MTETTTRLPLLSDLFALEDLQAEIDAGFVKRNRHPNLPLSIFTYTQAVVYERQWNHVTRRCRGLIAEDDTGRIVAWCLPKFFNMSEHDGGAPYAPPLPDEPFEVFDKVDGSYSATFHYDGRWHVASKGSFISDQATWAQAWLNAAGPDGVLDPGSTYLAEIVYPENRIVVNNGDLRTLVLLAVYDERGNEYPAASYTEQWEALGGRIVRSWRSVPLPELARMAEQNRKFDGTEATGTDAEGWVIRFASGVRVKCKHASYIKAHAIVTGTNERTIWEVLAAGQDIAGLFEQVPDEFRDWAVEVADRLRAEAAAWVAAARADFDRIGRLPDRKAFAIEAVKSEYRAALFRFYDGRDAGDLAWKSCRPSGATPFAIDEEA